MAGFESIRGRILYEDNHLIAINKTAGEISQGDKTGDPPLGDAVAKYIKEKYKKPGNVYLAVVHRLDRPVTGVSLFAKTEKAASRMSNLFREGRIEKTYWAIVTRRPPEMRQTLIHFLAKDSEKNKTRAGDSEFAGAKRSELAYELIGASDRYFLLRVTMKTGRHHQIRAQLAAIGCPIKGDLKYGAARSNPGGGISLHARSIVFTHPVAGAAAGAPIEIIAPPPDDALWRFFTTGTR